MKTHRSKLRRGFVLFFGTRDRLSPEGTPLHEVRCPRCTTTGMLGGARVRTWFTLFLVPVFPIGRGRHFTKCRRCAASFAMPVDQFEDVTARADAKQLERAIGLYNGLRASPGNSITMNELLKQYSSLGEYGQAIAAANDFPAAVDSSEQVMSTLGRVHLGAEKWIDAVHWFEKALARNPGVAEASFYLSLAVIKLNPQDRPRAIAAARAAKKAGHPEAEELLWDLEAED